MLETRRVCRPPPERLLLLLCSSEPVKLVLGTAVAIDILLQFFTYSTTPTTSKEAINHFFFFFFCLQRKNPIPQNPQTNSIQSSQILSSSYSHNNKKTKQFPNLKPPYPSPQTTVESQNRIKWKREKNRKKNSRTWRWWIEQHRKKRCEETNIKSVKSELQIRKSSSDARRRDEPGTSPITSSKDKPRSTNRWPTRGGDQDTCRLVSR